MGGRWVGSSPVTQPGWKAPSRPTAWLQLWLRRPAAQGQQPLRALPACAPARFPKSQPPGCSVSGPPPEVCGPEVVGRGICGAAAQRVSVGARGSSGSPEAQGEVGGGTCRRERTAGQRGALLFDSQDKQLRGPGPRGLGWQGAPRRPHRAWPLLSRAQSRWAGLSGLQRPEEGQRRPSRARESRAGQGPGLGLTWKTVRMAAGKVSKLVVGVSSLKLNLRKQGALSKAARQEPDLAVPVL